MEAMMGAKYKRKKFSEKIKKKDPQLLKIYTKMIEFDPHVAKVKNATMLKV